MSRSIDLQQRHKGTKREIRSSFSLLDFTTSLPASPCLRASVVSLFTVPGKAAQ